MLWPFAKPVHTFRAHSHMATMTQTFDVVSRSSEMDCIFINVTVHTWWQKKHIVVAKCEWALKDTEAISPHPDGRNDTSRPPKKHSCTPNLVDGRQDILSVSIGPLNTLHDMRQGIQWVPTRSMQPLSYRNPGPYGFLLHPWTPTETGTEQGTPWVLIRPVQLVSYSNHGPRGFLLNPSIPAQKGTSRSHEFLLDPCTPPREEQGIPRALNRPLQ